MTTEICIKIIPHSEQRYETVGDYWYDEKGVLQVRVSDMGNELYHKMIYCHELIEEALTKHNGISESVIMNFDLKFEANRAEGNVDEPGFDKNCPYIKEHTFATGVELGMCALSRTNFSTYDKTVNEL